MKKTVIFSLILCALLCLSACAPNAYQAPELLEPVGVKADLACVKRGEVSERSSYEFAVVPMTEKVLYAADGTLDEMCVVMGQRVEEGDVLLRLDVEDAQEQLRELDAHIVYVKKDNALTADLLRMDVEICEYEMDEARDYAHGTKKEQEKLDEYARVKEALEQELDRQELQMDQLYADRKLLSDRVAGSELKAPFAGEVVYIANEAGEGVRTGSIAVLLATDELILRGEYLSMAVMEEAEEMLALVKDKTCAVEYLPMDQEEYVSLLLSGAEMNTDFAFADGAPDGIRAGDYALLLVKTQVRKDVLYLPPNALQSDAAGFYVYRDNGTGGRERVDVKIGTRTGTAVEILEGLKEGDEVYVS